jgi:hypothetical protein
MLRGFAPVLALVAVLALAATVAAAEAKGKIRTVTADKHEFVVQETGGKSVTFMAARDCKVHLNDKEAKLTDLQADDEVTVTYEKDGDRMNATEIRATRK